MYRSPEERSDLIRSRLKKFREEKFLRIKGGLFSTILYDIDNNFDPLKNPECNTLVGIPIFTLVFICKCGNSQDYGLWFPIFKMDLFYLTEHPLDRDSRLMIKSKYLSDKISLDMIIERKEERNKEKDLSTMKFNCSDFEVKNSKTFPDQQMLWGNMQQNNTPHLQQGLPGSFQYMRQSGQLF